MGREIVEQKLESLRCCLLRIEVKTPATADILAADSNWQDIVSLNLSRAVQQLEEIRQVTRRAKIRALILPALAGQLVNQPRSMTLWLDNLPKVDKSTDPFDNLLLAMAAAGAAQVLVSGDTRGVLALRSHGNCQILTVREFVAQLGLH